MSDKQPTTWTPEHAERLNYLIAGLEETLADDDDNVCGDLSACDLAMLQAARAEITRLRELALSYAEQIAAFLPAEYSLGDYANRQMEVVGNTRG